MYIYVLLYSIMTFHLDLIHVIYIATIYNKCISLEARHSWRRDGTSEQTHVQIWSFVLDYFYNIIKLTLPTHVCTNNAKTYDSRVCKQEKNWNEDRTESILEELIQGLGLDLSKK